MTITIFILLALFGIKHFIADFLMQYDYMLREKGIFGATGGLHHAIVHASFTFLILVFFCPNVNTIIALSFADFVLHYHIDYFKNKHIISLPTLTSFFEYNDNLDNSRNIRLID